jgi:hypothetical protein
MEVTARYALRMLEKAGLHKGQMAYLNLFRITRISGILLL